MTADEKKTRVTDGDIGYAVLTLLEQGRNLTQENIASLIENKRAEVQDALYVLLHNRTAQLIKNGYQN